MEIKELTDKLENLEISIVNDEKRKNQLIGKQESIQEKLKSDFNIKESEIDTLLEKNKSGLQKLEAEIEKDLKELESL